jgi:hypothetical protein
MLHYSIVTGPVWTGNWIESVRWFQNLQTSGKNNLTDRHSDILNQRYLLLSFSSMITERTFCFWNDIPVIKLSVSWIYRVLLLTTGMDFSLPYRIETNSGVFPISCLVDTCGFSVVITLPAYVSQHYHWITQVTPSFSAAWSTLITLPFPSLLSISCITPTK